MASAQLRREKLGPRDTSTSLSREVDPGSEKYLPCRSYVPSAAGESEWDFHARLGIRTDVPPSRYPIGVGRALLS